jgi:hypothetical protein
LILQVNLLRQERGSALWCHIGAAPGASLRGMEMGVDSKGHRRHQESDMDIVHQLHEAADISLAHENELLDEGLDESFPASDPAAVNITRIVDDAKVRIVAIL